MHRLNRIAAVLGVLAFGLCLSVSDAEAKTRITGKVTDLDGKPIEGAVIEVTDTKTERTQKAESKKDGKWAVLVDGAAWKFVAKAKGYKTVTDTKPLEALGNLRKPNLDFSMEPGEDAPEGAAAPVAVAPAAEPEGTPQPQIDLTDLKAGNLLMDQGQYKEAVAAYEVALAKNPTLHQIHIAVADAHVKLEAWDSAIGHYKQVPDTDTMYERAQLGIANAYVHLKKMDDALKAYKAVLAKNPANPDANYVAGQILFDRGEAQESLKFLEAAAAGKADWAPVQLKLGYVHVNLGNNAAAKKAFQKYLELSPTAPDAADVKAMIDML